MSRTFLPRLLRSRVIQVQAPLPRVPVVSSTTRTMASATAGKAGRKLKRLPAAYYRGGTSRAVMFDEKDLPADRGEWGPIFLGVIGSPDPNGRQLDGMGGGLSSLSKVCVVGKSPQEGVDVNYTFIALGVKTNEVDFSSNCGNMTSAIGPFAIDAGIMSKSPSINGTVTVRINNTNTNKLIDSTFPIVPSDNDGPGSGSSPTSYEAAPDGDFAIDGVPGSAARIELAFLDPAGSRTGKLLPSGKPVDVIDGVRVSLVDCGNPCCFVLASDLGVTGTLLPEQIENDGALLERLERIREQASVRMGLSKEGESAAGSVPKIAMVSKPVTHKVLSGEEIEESSVDVVVRAMSVGQPHRAVPITVAMAVAAAARVGGSTVNGIVEGRKGVDEKGLTLGHASGKIVVGASFEGEELTNATVYRTARRLMDGTVYWKGNQ